MTSDVVITGIGTICPLGIGHEAVWPRLLTGVSGVGPLRAMAGSGLPARVMGTVTDFDAKAYVKPRKRLKLMGRDAQLGVSAAVLAWRDAALRVGEIDPERIGVVLGADANSMQIAESEESYRRTIVDGQLDFHRWVEEIMSRVYPLCFLKVLPNMIASHVSIAHDARGPSNTIYQGTVSSLLAVREATRVIQRGDAEVMLVGGASCIETPTDWVFRCSAGRVSTRGDDPSAVMRPFDAQRDGEVLGEGATIFVLENRRHAELRGATVWGHVLGCASTCNASTEGRADGTAIRRAIASALQEAGIRPRDVGHVNAQGTSTVQDDRIEATALRDTLPDIPVTAPRGHFGNLGAAGGTTETAASLLGLRHGMIAPTLNYHAPDPDCPVRVVRDEPLALPPAPAVNLNWTRGGQAVAVVIGPPESSGSASVG